MVTLSYPQSRTSAKKTADKQVTYRKASHRVTTKKVTKKIQSPYGKKIKRYAKLGIKSLLLSPSFHTTFKVFFGILIGSSLLYTSYAYIGKTFANEVIVSQGEIISRVKKLTPLPEGVPSEIVRVQDEEDLKKQNPFYKDVKEGDYILMYKDMAVIYDLRANAIVAVKHSEK
jgi:hypothetical protein